jgi:hypothetical protein
MFFRYWDSNPRAQLECVPTQPLRQEAQHSTSLCPLLTPSGAPHIGIHITGRRQVLHRRRQGQRSISANINKSGQVAISAWYLTTFGVMAEGGRNWRWQRSTDEITDRRFRGFQIRSFCYLPLVGGEADQDSDWSPLTTELRFICLSAELQQKGRPCCRQPSLRSTHSLLLSQQFVHCQPIVCSLVSPLCNNGAHTAYCFSHLS